MRYFYFFISLICFAACDVSTQPQTQLTTNSNNNLPTNQQDSTRQPLKIRLGFIGDIMGHGDQIVAAMDEKTKLYDYEICFRYVRNLFEQQDFMVGNLELTLSNKGKYTGYPRFRTPDALAFALKNAGFDFLVTANNHSNDGDLYGITHTLDILDSIKMPHTGTFRDSAEYAKTYPYIHTHKLKEGELRIAYLNYSYGTNGIPTPKPAIVNLIDTVQMLKDIETVKKSKPHLIVALVHWGSEYQLNERTEQQNITKMLWRNGVKVVIGAHPHVVQPIKTDTVDNKMGGKTINYCAYSLGNFISNQNQKNTDIGLMVELDLVQNQPDGELELVSHDYVLLWRYIHNKSAAVVNRNYIVVPAAAFENDTTKFMQMSASDLAAMRLASENMRKHLSKWGATERKVTMQEVLEGNVKKPNE